MGGPPAALALACRCSAVDTLPVWRMRDSEWAPEKAFARAAKAAGFAAVCRRGRTARRLWEGALSQEAAQCAASAATCPNSPCRRIWPSVPHHGLSLTQPMPGCHGTSLCCARRALCLAQQTVGAPHTWRLGCVCVKRRRVQPREQVALALGGGGDRRIGDTRAACDDGLVPAGPGIRRGLDCGVRGEAGVRVRESGCRAPECGGGQVRDGSC